MSNIIIVGDSFCEQTGWGEILAQQLDCNLFRRGFGGHSWWSTRQTLLNEISDDFLSQTEYIVFCHTSGSRILKQDENIARLDFNNKADTREIVTAVRLYYKYIYDDQVAEWTQEQWFKEISETYYKKFKLIHLHCFPWSWNKRHLLKGMNVGPNLASISLNEMGANSESQLAFCGRNNHLNEVNNIALGKELFRLISNYTEEDMYLDLHQFEQKTNKWTNWK